MTLFNKILSGKIETVCFPKMFSEEDIFSYALLLTINRGLEVEFITKDQARTMKDDESLLLINIGGGEFDTKQAIFDMREGTDIKMSAFCKLWMAIGPDYVGEDLTDAIKENYIYKVEDEIRTGDSNKLSIITTMKEIMPLWNEKADDEEMRIAFLKSANFISIALERSIADYNSYDKALDIVWSEFEENAKDHVLFFNCWNPAIEVIEEFNKSSEDDSQVYFAVYAEDDSTLAVDSFKDKNGKIKTAKSSDLKKPKDELLAFLRELCK